MPSSYIVLLNRSVAICYDGIKSVIKEIEKMLSVRLKHIVNTFLITMGLAYIVDFVVFSYVGYSISFIALSSGILAGSIIIGNK